MQHAIDAMEPGGGLDLRHQVDRPLGYATIALEIPDQPIDCVQVRRALHFRQDDPFDAGMQHLVQIAEAETRRWRVHPHIAAAAPWLLECARDDLAGRGLFRDRDRILQIDDDGVSFERECFLHTARDVARREKE